MARHASRIERAAARNILRRCLNVKRGENVLIEVWDHNLPFASAFVDEVCQLGAQPYVQYQDRDAFWSEFRRGSPRYFGNAGAIERAALEAADAYVYFMGPEDLYRSFQKARKSPRFWKAFVAYQEPFYEIARRTGLRGSRLSIAYADRGDARKWNVKRSTWHRELMQAYQVDPRSMLRDASRLSYSLVKGRRLSIRHPNGTSLDFRLNGARPSVFAGVHGRDDVRPRTHGWGDPTVLNDLPWGVLSVRVAPHSGNGTLVSNRPSYYGWGKTEGACWTFRRGALVERRFEGGGRGFSRHFSSARGGPERSGSLLIGLNPAIHRAPNVQFSELAAVSVQLGQGQISSDYPSALYPKATLAGGTVVLDDRPIVRAGRIL
ncbi:MAG TPA: hypothetical protein VEL82_01680 [Thermoplasmata archaeon]|nr:hypothetical protein [Thermoplasmata archaeon]